MSQHLLPIKRRRERNNTACVFASCSDDLDKQRVTFNISGKKFEVFRSTMKNIPDTRLAWLSENISSQPEYDNERNEFFIERHAVCFEAVLQYYRTGHLHMPAQICGPLFEEELDYWGIDPRATEPCCWTRYHQYRNTEETMSAMLKDYEDNSSQSSSEREEPDVLHDIVHFLEAKSASKWQKYHLGLNRFRAKVHRIMDKPTTCSGQPFFGHITMAAASMVYSSISVSMILVSILVFCLESHMSFRIADTPDDHDGNASSPTLNKHNSRPHPVLDVFDMITLGFFTLELLVRFAVHPSKKQFFQQWITWVELCSVVPLYIIIILKTSTLVKKSDIEPFRGVTMARVLMLLKVARHHQGLKVLAYTLKASFRELSMLVLFLGLGVLFSAVLVFYAENVISPIPNTDFENIPICFWWAIVTMTTVGYGDLHPKTTPGYFVGAACSVMGVLMVALPIPVIVNNFALYYQHSQALANMPKRSRNVLSSATIQLRQAHTSLHKTHANSNKEPPQSPQVVNRARRRWAALRSLLVVERWLRSPSPAAATAAAAAEGGGSSEQNSVLPRLVPRQPCRTRSNFSALKFGCNSLDAKIVGKASMIGTASSTASDNDGDSLIKEEDCGRDDGVNATNISTEDLGHGEVKDLIDSNRSTPVHCDEPEF